MSKALPHSSATLRIAASILAVIVGLGCNSAHAEAVPAEWSADFAAVDKELQNNLLKPDIWVPYYHVRPAPKYSGVYLWDSAFISLIWKVKNPSIAKDVLRSVLHFQEANGMVPQMVSFTFGFADRRPVTNPPLLSFAAAEIATAVHDVAFAREVYPRLKRFQAWLWRSRRLANGLFFWKEPYESGMDNAPRFGNRDESHYINTTNVASVDLASYVVVDAESLLRLAQLQLAAPSGAPGEAQTLHTDIANYEAEIAQVSQLTQDYLWDDTSGMFFDRNVQSGKFIRINTIESFFPLFAGIANDQQWAKMRTHLVSPQEYNTPNPLGSVARNSPAFEKDCWRGPIWVNTAYMVIKGLERYHDEATAKDFTQRVVNTVYKTWETTGKFVEFYDPQRFDFKELTRKKGTGWLGFYGSLNPIDDLSYFFGKVVYLGDKPVDHFVGWTGLVNTMIIEDL